MSRKIYLPVMLIVMFAMLLGACAPAAEPVVEQVVEEPTTVVVVEEPTAVPTPEPVVEEVDYLELFTEVVDSNPADKSFNGITADKLNTELVENPDLFLLDVRQPAEYETDGYIDTAYFAAIPLRDLMDNLDKIPGLDDPIVVYCKGGHRGAVAMAALQAVGYTNVRNLLNGINGWNNAELPVVKAVPPSPEAISTPVVENERLFSEIRDYMANLPDGFLAITPPQLDEMIINGEDMTLIDVRPQSDFDNGYIESAILIPFSDFMTSLDQLPAKDGKIVLYCGSGHRGGILLVALNMMGYTNVVNLNGGLGAWKAAELPVVGAAPDLTKIFADVVASNPSDKSFNGITADQLNTELVENPELFILDVRQPAEYETDGYIDTLNFAAIPLRDLLDNLDKLPDLDEPIVIYCKGGHRGAVAMAALQAIGYTDVRNLLNGINAWNNAQLPVIKAVPTAPEAISTPIVADEKLFTIVRDYLANLPDGFLAISATQLNEMIINGDDFALVDVRPQSDFDSGHIEDAILIPYSEFLDNLDLLPTKDEKIVLYCGSGHRGGILLVALNMMGYTDVVNLNGGIGAWKAAELPVVTP